MFPETHRLKHDCGTSETVNPGAEFADPVDGIFVIEETVLLVQFSFRTAGKIAFYLIPDICLVVEANFYVFRLLGEAVSPYLRSEIFDQGDIAALDFCVTRP